MNSIMGKAVFIQNREPICHLSQRNINYIFGLTFFSLWLLSCRRFCPLFGHIPIAFCIRVNFNKISKFIKHFCIFSKLLLFRLNLCWIFSNCIVEILFILMNIWNNAQPSFPVNRLFLFFGTYNLLDMLNRIRSTKISLKTTATCWSSFLFSGSYAIRYIWTHLRHILLNCSKCRKKLVLANKKSMLVVSNYRQSFCYYFDF